jgi:deoxycytidylate deaminase
MNAPEGDPTYIKNKDKYFMEVAKTIALASTHPTSPGGCVIVRDREIIGDGRSILCASKVEVDCLTYAIGATSKRGTPTTGSTVYTTRYPFSPSIFQCYIMGIKRIFILAHEWEPYYKDEFRRAARLARELSISIEPLFDDDKKMKWIKRNVDPELFQLDQYDPKTKNETINDDPTSL